MLTDRYDLVLSTASSAARDAYVQASDLALTFYPGAAEAYDRAIAADPGFALAYASKAQVLMRQGDFSAARAALAVAKEVSAGLSEREASHIGFLDLVFAGKTEPAIAALYGHLTAWPRDALIVAIAGNPNGLIGSSGCVGQKHRIAALMDSLAPHYGDDFWFVSYPRDGFFYGHLSWHLSLCEIEAGNWTEALRLYHDAMALDRHSGGPQQKMSDGAAFLWRSELAGHPRDAAAWHALHEYANSSLPRPGNGLADLHVILAQAVMRDEAALDARARQMEALAR